MGMSPITFFVVLLIVCTLIGIFAVLAGVGGGVIFTPLFMGFTSIDSYVIRSTGLFVAMAGALVAARPFLRRRIANIRILVTGAVPYALFAVIGALLAGYIEHDGRGRGSVHPRSPGDHSHRNRRSFHLSRGQDRIPGCYKGRWLHKTTEPADAVLGSFARQGDQLQGDQSRSFQG